MSNHSECNDVGRDEMRKENDEICSDVQEVVEDEIQLDHLTHEEKIIIKDFCLNLLILRAL